MVYEELVIHCPKRAVRRAGGSEGFYPYYAGFPASFARSIIQSAALSRDATIFDPWNGSGTTTVAAAELGYESLGYDLNPAMVVVARARLLPGSEASSLRPLAKEILRRAGSGPFNLEEHDPLEAWFVPQTAQVLRRIEAAIRHVLVGELASGSAVLDVDNLSMIAATYYVALFSVCRNLTKKFRTTNPTWLRHARHDSERIRVPLIEIESNFLQSVNHMAENLAARLGNHGADLLRHIIKRADSTVIIADKSADLVLTSPPYCTRIDYTTATRVELALLNYSDDTAKLELGRSMMGSTKVPSREINLDMRWGDRCVGFLSRLREHKSKASSGYYFKVHADYFDKMYRSLGNLSRSLKTGGSAIMVVQDSHYKDIHNDVPGIVVEMAGQFGLELRRRENFVLRNSISQINSRSQMYRSNTVATESVLCFCHIG